MCFITMTKWFDVSFVLPSELYDKVIDIIPLQYCIYQLKRDITSIAFGGITLFQTTVKCAQRVIRRDSQLTYRPLATQQ